MGIKDIPIHLMQMCIFPYFTSRELFAMRAIGVEFGESIKVSWCQAVKEEMLQQVRKLQIYLISGSFIRFVVRKGNNIKINRFQNQIFAILWRING